MFGESLAQLLHQRSDALSVVASSSSGRTLVLTRPVARGETVIRESALVKAAHFVGSRCANCLCQLNDRPHGSPIVRCCELASYCSAECSRADATLHTSECGNLPSGISVPESTLCRLALRLLGIVAQDAQRAARLRFNVLVDGRIRVELRPAPTVPSSASLAALTGALVGPEAELDASRARLRELARLLAERAPASQHCVVHGAEPASVEELLYETLCRCQCNGFQICGGDGEDDCDVPPGTSLHLLVCLSLNHACRPNVVCCHEGTTLVVRALQPLEAGTELLTSYIPAPLLMQHSTARRRSLRRTHGFTCACARCVDDEPMMRSARCRQPRCKGLLPMAPPIDTPRADDSSSEAPPTTPPAPPTCSTCSAPAPDWASALRAAAQTRLAHTLASRNVEALETAAEGAATWLHACHSDRVLLLHKLLDALVAAGGEEEGERELGKEEARLRSTLRAAKQLLKASVASLPAYHPHHGTLLTTMGNASLHLALLLSRASGGAEQADEATSLLSDAAKFFERAYEMLAVSFGPTQPAVRRALRMKAAVQRRLREPQTPRTDEAPVAVQ